MNVGKTLFVRLVDFVCLEVSSRAWWPGATHTITRRPADLFGEFTRFRDLSFGASLKALPYRLSQFDSALRTSLCK